MATTKATTTADLESAKDTRSSDSGGDELSGRALITDDDRRTADLSVDDRKTSSATLKSGTKVTGPADVISKIKGQ